MARGHEAVPSFYQLKRRATGLPLGERAVSLPVMQQLARLLQLAGLTVPPLALLAQLSNFITAGQMLGFLVASVCMFSLGYLLQRASAGR